MVNRQRVAARQCDSPIIAGEDHAQHLLDFAVLLRVLTPGPSDLMLDLGAGSCWVSDWLRRCGIKTTAVDISFDMLRLGATRLGGARGRAVGDMEQLPFADGVFSKACCLNAFHHVPDTRRALGEIKRVLAPDGVAFFSEPGVGHANHPTSLAASRNYGVLENEILIDDFMESCLGAGFADVRLHPMSHIMPLFEVDNAQWQAWRTFTASTRPFRALEKMWRAALEVVGLAKKDLLFEEAFAIRLRRELQPMIEQQSPREQCRHNALGDVANPRTRARGRAIAVERRHFDQSRSLASRAARAELSGSQNIAHRLDVV